MRHYTEVDLLELCYLPPSEMVPVRAHLSECADCTLRYDGLQRKLRSAATVGCPKIEEKPQTYWDRQRFAVMRKVQGKPIPQSHRISNSVRVAAAALVLIASTALIYRASTPVREPEPASVMSTLPQTEVDAAAEVLQELRAVNDPWGSEELSEFRGIVEWESWTADPEDVVRGES